MNRAQKYISISYFFAKYKISDFKSYDALVGVTSHDWFHHQPEESLTKGISKETKEKYLRSYILNNYENHLKEIFLAVNNEYSEWDQVLFAIYRT